METRGEGRGAAWALGRRVDLGPVDGSVAVEKARVVCELLEEANNISSKNKKQTIVFIKF